MSFFSKLSLLEERHTQLSTHEICCENLKMDTECKNQITVRRKCELHIIFFYINKRISIKPHCKIINSLKQLRKQGCQQTSFVTTLVKLASISKMAISTRYLKFNIQYRTYYLIIMKKKIKVSNVYNSKSTCRCLRVAVVIYLVCTEVYWQTYVSKAWVQTS